MDASWNSFLGTGPSFWDIVSETRNPNPEIASKACEYIKKITEEGRISSPGEYMKKFIEKSCGAKT